MASYEKSKTLDFTGLQLNVDQLSIGGTVLEGSELTALDGLAAELALLDGVTATAAEINAAADVSTRLVEIPDATTYTVLAANSGKVHVFPDLTADITVTLPTAAAGLEYEFWYVGAAADAQDWIFDTTDDAIFFTGGLVHNLTSAGDTEDEIVTVFADGDSNSIMTILTPEAGTTVKVISDGTGWYVNGNVVSADPPTFADQTP